MHCYQQKENTCSPITSPKSISLFAHILKCILILGSIPLNKANLITPVIQRFVNRYISYADSVRCLKDHIKEIGENYNADINRQHKKGPVFLDSVAFSKIKRLLTWYSLGELKLYNNLINISKTNKFLELLATEWGATKKLGDLVESGEEEEVELIVSNEGTHCPLLCELPLRWSLPCRHWMYPAFVDVIPIPSLLIHPRWFFDGPDHLTNTWKMSFDPTLPAPTTRFSTIHTDQTGPTFVTSRMDTEEVYERHAGDQYRDHGKNMMMKAPLDVIEKQKAFHGAAAEDFARAFQKQTVEISEAVKERLERQQILPAQLPPSFKESNLRKFPNKIGQKWL